jgi:putative ABC transport system substrate-binding protein
VRKIALRLVSAPLVLAVIAFSAVCTESYAASPRIGFLGPGTPESSAMVLEGLRQGLRDHGYIEGANIAIESRFARDQLERLPDLSRELIGLPVDVLVTFVTQASIAAKDNTKTIPIVMIAVSDPVASKLVSSLSHPGGNVTGTSGMFSEGAGKRLQMLKEAAPGLQSVAVIWNPNNRVFQSQMIQETEAAAKRLGIRLKMFEAYDVTSIERIFAAISNERALGLNILPDTTLGTHARQSPRWRQKRGCRPLEAAPRSRRLAASSVTAQACVNWLATQVATSRRSSEARSRQTFPSSSQRRSSSLST